MSDDIDDGTVTDDSQATDTDGGAGQARPVAEVGTAQTGRHRGGRRRQAASAVCGVFSVMLILIGLAGLWFMQTVEDSNWVERQVAATLRNPEVSDALANQIVDEMDSAIDFDELFAEVFPPAVARAAPLLSATARSVLVERVSALIRSDRVVAIVARAVAASQRTAIAVLDGADSVDGIAIENGEVRVNLLPVIPEVLTAAQRLGVFSNVTVPDLSGATPDEQRALLSDALGRPLGPQFGEPVVFRSEALANADQTLQTVRSVLLWTRRLFWLLLLAGLGFAAGAIYLARNRPRATVILGTGFVVGLLLIRLVVGRAMAQIPPVIGNPGGAAAVGQVVDGAVRRLTVWYLWFAAVAVAAVTGVYWLLSRRTGDAESHADAT